MTATQIVKVAYLLSGASMKSTIQYYNCKETNKSFITDNSRIDKERHFMKIDTDWREKHNLYGYHTWCLPSQIEDAKSDILEHIKMRFQIVKQEYEMSVAAFDENIEATIYDNGERLTPTTNQ